MTNNDSKYTDPELRTEIKESIQESDKGGKSGQWSARKAQMMASEYKKAMEERGEAPYTTDKSDKDDRQKHLSDWTDEKWQTSDGKAEAKQEDGSEKRYLPKAAWDKMTEEEKNETNEAKLEGGKNGEQYVSNTAAAKCARQEAAKEREGENDDTEENHKDGKMNEDSGKEQNDNANRSKRERPEEPSNGTGETSEAEGGEQSLSRAEEQEESQPKKKQKTNDGKQRQVGRRTAQKVESNGNEDVNKGDEGHGKPGSVDRLPAEGQSVHWRAASGWCEGTVLEILHDEKEIAGRKAKASENDPRIVLKSAKSGKSAVHKPGSVYF